MQVRHITYALGGGVVTYLVFGWLYPLILISLGITAFAWAWASGKNEDLRFHTNEEQRE